MPDMRTGWSTSVLGAACSMPRERGELVPGARASQRERGVDTRQGQSIGGGRGALRSACPGVLVLCGSTRGGELSRRCFKLRGCVPTGRHNIFLPYYYYNSRILASEL